MMRLRTLVIYCGVLTLLQLTHRNAYAQCSSSAETWLDNLSVIESNDQLPSEKIKLLNLLKESYQACGLKKDSVYARIVHRLGDVYRLNGDFQNGIKFAREAVAINRSNQLGAQKSYLTHSYYNLGLYHNLLGLLDEAHLYYDSCIAIGSQFPEKVFIALMAFEKKAFMYFQTGDYDRSIQVADVGISLAQKHNDSEFEALLLIQKAQALAELDKVSVADQDIGKSIEILTKNEFNDYLANAYSVYANILSRKKKYTEAIAYYNNSFALNEAQQNIAQCARDLHDLAFLYDKNLHNAEKAIALYTKAIALSEQQQDVYMTAASYNNIGQVYHHEKAFDKALKHFQKGLNTLPIEFHSHDPKINPDTRSLKLVSNDFIAANLLWNKGDAWLEYFNTNNDTAILHYALSAYLQGDRMVDQMRWKQQGEQSKLFWREKTKKWYEKAIDASFKLDDAASAFYFMEKSRAVLLNDKLAELGAKNHLPASEAAKENALRLKLKETFAEASAGREEVWSAQKEFERFIQQLEKSYPAYYQYKYDTSVYALTDLQKNLTQDQAWLELFVTDSAIYTITISSSNTLLKKIHSTNHRIVADRLSNLISNKELLNQNFATYQSLSHQYYKQVFEPLHIVQNRITISQDAYFIPFDVLLKDSTAATSFLLHDYAFSYAYSATSQLRRQKNNETSAINLLGVAPVDYSSRLHLTSLKGADNSIRNIESVYVNGKYLTQEKATRTAFLKSLPNFGIVHLYSHALADTAGSEPTIFFYDSALYLSDLQNLPSLKTNLVVLLACNSAVGKNIKGEGVLSLARGFASAGIPSTISALWKIDDRATYGLAELFYKKLSNGLPTDVALQQAKIELINSNDKEYELPYFWAGSVLIGEPQTFIMESQALAPGLKITIYLLSVLALIVVAFLLYRNGKEKFFRREHFVK